MDVRQAKVQQLGGASFNHKDIRWLGAPTMLTSLNSSRCSVRQCEWRLAVISEATSE